jgi:hypothetical protein
MVGSPVVNEELQPEAKTGVESHAAATTAKTRSASVTYAFGALPPSDQSQAGQLPLVVSAGAVVTENSPTSQPFTLRLVGAEPEPSVVGASNEQRTSEAQPFAFRLVDSQPVETQGAQALKQDETPTLRFANPSGECDSAETRSEIAATVTSSAAQRTALHGKSPTASVTSAVSSRTPNSKRRPGAWRQCVEHPQVKSEVMCPTCAVGYCGECKKPICSTCDTPCIEASGYQKWLEQQRIRSRPMMEEIKTILAYPLQDPMAFLIFALITGFFKFASLFSHRVVIFSTGILLWYSFHTLYQVASGNMKRLLPEFNDMSDLIQPIRLSLAALAISWGPAVLVGLLFVANTESTGIDVGSMVAGATGVSTETIAHPVNVDKQVQEKVQGLLGGIGGEEAEGEAVSEDDIPQKHIVIDVPTKESSVSPSHSSTSSVLPFSQATTGSGLSLLLFVALFWKTAYTPVALIVAALSKNLKSVVNPFIGITTIRRMGVVYLHVMIIYTGLTGAEWAFGKMFDFFPLVGLVGMAFARAYFALAIGCALGLAVYKKAPELGWD